MGGYLKSKVKEYKFLINGSLDDMRDGLESGYKIITHGWFTSYGHVISIVDFKGDNFICDDPWAEFNFPTFSYDFSKTGDDVKYSALGIYATCVAGKGYGDSRNINRRGKLSNTENGAWVHLIKN
jgi:hypothetical protein